MVRTFTEKGQVFITGIKFLNAESNTVAGDVSLYDFGDWHEQVLHKGDWIIGMYGIKNNLIRGIGFILFNPNPPKLVDLENSNEFDFEDTVTISSRTISNKQSPAKQPRSPMRFNKQTRAFEFIPKSEE